MTCAACVGVVENALKGVDGVKSAGVTCHLASRLLGPYTIK